LRVRGHGVTMGGASGCPRRKLRAQAGTQADLRVELGGKCLFPRVGRELLEIVRARDGLQPS
jgi:hypothetical protein